MLWSIVIENATLVDSTLAITPSSDSGCDYNATCETEMFL
jgi:hypothetical protein